MKYNKKQTLRSKAISIMQANPDISTNEFAELIGKKAKHAASLMSAARKELGISVWDFPPKPDKTMALIYLGMNIKGREFREKLKVNACRASELRQIARQRLSEGRLPSPDAIAWATGQCTPASVDKSPSSAHPEGNVKRESKPKKRSKRRGSQPALTTESNASGDVSVRSLQAREPRKPEDLILAAGLNPNEWIISAQTMNVWEMGALHPDTGEILVEPLFQTKVRLEPVGGAQGIMAAINSLIENLRINPPKLPDINYEKITDGHMVEIAIPDLHLGKYAAPNETGEAYSPEIACRIFRSALHDLIGQAVNAYQLDKIVLPIGNDFLTADTLANTTTRGTPQDVAGNFQAHFTLGFNLLREAVEKLRMIAPLDIIVVPGNHDTVASFALGEILGAVYEADKSVTVHNKSHYPRKYISYGLNLLGYAHGHNEKNVSLPMKMAQEAPKAWGFSRHREIHLGHLHHTKDIHFLGTNEEDGVIIRVIPSLSAADRWHASKGYRSQRAALAMIYHPMMGHRATFRHSILDALQVEVPKAA